MPTISSLLHQLDQAISGCVQERSCVCRKKKGTDACALVITLRWPANSGNQAFPDQSGLFKGTVQRQAPPDARTPSGRARLWWREVRMLLIEFNRARRCHVPSCCLTPKISLLNEKHGNIHPINMR